MQLTDDQVVTFLMLNYDLYIIAPADDGFSQDVQQIEGARWDKRLACWCVPHTGANIERVRQLMRQYFGHDDQGTES